MYITSNHQHKRARRQKKFLHSIFYYIQHYMLLFSTFHNLTSKSSLCRAFTLPNTKSQFRKSAIMTLSQPSSSTSSSPHIATQKVAKLISSCTPSLQSAGERIRQGLLVSFPTETVYGLGCHALDANAVQKVFLAKERPLTDPLIVHVNHASSALDLWYASSSSSSSKITDADADANDNAEHKVLQSLTATFWPGPLTIVAKASSKVPSIIMANTGFVACRSPSHPIARKLIECSSVPIAAPSANKFGHVSPTKAMHVLDDLGMEDVWIVDPDLNQNDHHEHYNNNNNNNNKNNVVCDVGVESTVAKVEINQEGIGFITILRHGAVSQQDILKCIQKDGLDTVFQVQSKQQSTGDDVNNVAPGQTIKHYSPNVTSFIVSHERYENGEVMSEEERYNLANSVIIDFGGRLESLKEIALAYRDLSAEGDSSKAAANVFDTLRWSETVESANRVYFPELVVEDDIDDALILAVKDRLTRAASGVVVKKFT